ncbi:MAG: sulfurtransferase [Betaproteobacteria bacterium]|nr:sulfurtransferase [Betaproteobacteria bacterium]
MMNPVLSVKDLLIDPSSWIIIDCRHQLSDPDWGYQQYLEGHLPNARFVHLDNDLSGPKTGLNGRHPLPSPEQLISLFRRLGISQHSKVVAYDDMGGCFAARCWWSLKWLGFDQVAVLNGGIQSWLKAGGELSYSLPTVIPGDFEGQPQSGWVVGAAEVLENLNSEHYLLVDARGSDRFRGDNETIDPVGGHIPGAVNRPFMNNLDEHKCFKSPLELHKEFSELTVSEAKRPIIHQCGSGVSACHNWLAMHYAGVTTPLLLYPGSWSEWVADPLRPIAK